MGIWPLLNFDVKLAVETGAQDVAPRFCELFRAMWSRLPTSVQSDLTRIWQSSEEGCPKFFLLADLLDHAPRIGTFGIFSGQARFDFSATKVRDMPDALVEALIAHELPHCFLGHTGDYSTEHEGEADALVLSWGFPMERLRVFLEP